MEKKPCPRCGEPNYEGSPACWACGAPLTGPRAVVLEPEPAPDATSAEIAEPVNTATDETAPGPAREADAAPESGDLKPAAREAQALQDKAYVTPPVDVEDGPRGPVEWVAYAFQALGHSATGFKEALDDYDRRRGRKSGAMSSYGCAVTGLLAALFVALLVAVISYVSRGHG